MWNALPATSVSASPDVQHAGPSPGRATAGNWLLIALTAAAVLWFVTFGRNRSLWQDDANALLMARQGFSGLLQALRNDNNLPAYYVLLSAWIRLFGDSEPAVRSLAAVFYVAGGIATGLLARAIARKSSAGVYAAVLYLAAGQVIRQAQSVRMYTMLGLLSALSLLLFVKIFIERRRGWAVAAAYVAVNTIGALTQVWFAFVLFGQLLYQAIGSIPTGGRKGAVPKSTRPPISRFLTLLTVPAAAFAALWGRSFLVQLHNGSTAWLPPFQLWFIPDAFLEFYGSPMESILVFGTCIVLALRARGTPIPDARRLLFASLAACILAPLAISIVKPIYAAGRYTTVALPAMAALLGCLLAHYAARRFALVFCGAVLTLSAAAQVLDRPDPQSDRATAEYLLRHAAPGDAVVFTSLTRPAADYYFHRLGAESRYAEFSFPAELQRHPGWRDNAAMLQRPAALQSEARELAQQAAQHPHVWLYYGYDTPVSDYVKKEFDRKFRLDARYGLHGPFHATLLVYAP